MSDFILLNKHDDGVYVLTFNRPQVLNALNLAAMTAFQQQINALQTDAGLRVLVLTGAGERAFCSGGDLHELSQHPTEADALHFISLMGDALLMMERLPVPVIAAVNGYALGGGSEIALACDMRIVGGGVRMGMVQINMGLTPGWGAGQRLLRAVGYSKALELMLRGTILRAEDLRAIGLANHVTNPGEALTFALELAHDIANRPPDVVRGIKQLARAGLKLSYGDALRAERDIFPPLWAADAHLNAVDAFLQRQAQKAQNSEDNN